MGSYKRILLFHTIKCLDIPLARKQFAEPCSGLNRVYETMLNNEFVAAQLGQICLLQTETRKRCFVNLIEAYHCH